MADNRESGSFLTGFTVGIFAGAAGYFLFGTSRGQKMRERLAQEWNQARHEVDNGQFSNLTIRDIISSAIKVVSPSESPTKTPARKHTKGASTKEKFKGV